MSELTYILEKWFYFVLRYDGIRKSRSCFISTTFLRFQNPYRLEESGGGDLFSVTKSRIFSKLTTEKRK